MKIVWFIIILLASPSAGLSGVLPERHQNAAPVLNHKNYQRDLNTLYQQYHLPVIGDSYFIASDDRPSSARGWKLIKKSRHLKALKVFEKVAKKDPANGEHVVGYALAAALLDRLDEGAAAMRNALEKDPDALDKVKVDDRLKAKFSIILSKYTDGTNPLSDSDNHLMRASLYYLMGDANAYTEELKKAPENATQPSAPASDTKGSTY